MSAYPGWRYRPLASGNPVAKAWRASNSESKKINTLATERQTRCVHVRDAKMNKEEGGRESKHPGHKPITPRTHITVVCIDVIGALLPTKTLQFHASRVIGQNVWIAILLPGGFC